MAKKMGLMAACRDYFGLKEGQTALDFGKEYKALSDKDKAEIQTGLEKEGYEITASPVTPVRVAVAA